mmetsp:Transcript_9594/g.19525  ORF Transcript_9594/g.19525 Transcript_9594/m.19525 type:complete len:102 (+) Transcript_9594:144-449(+)
MMCKTFLRVVLLSVVLLSSRFELIQADYEDVDSGKRHLRGPTNPLANTQSPVNPPTHSPTKSPANNLTFFPTANKELQNDKKKDKDKKKNDKKKERLFIYP